MDLSEVTTDDLISELCKRQGVQKLNAGLYTHWELISKYSLRDMKLPDNYELLLITPSIQQHNN